MNNAFTIFFGEKPYHITAELTPELQQLANTAGTLIANQPDANLLAQTIRDMDAPGTKAVILLTAKPGEYWQLFQSHFTPVTAGGGIVYNENGELLFIFRRGKWDLPKGKMDKGETIEDCALREVKEETGLKEVTLKSAAGNTYHTYREKGKHILKTSVWFIMEANGKQALIPQTEEDIEAMAWLPANRWNEVFTNTFPAIKLILQQPGA